MLDYFYTECSNCKKHFSLPLENHDMVTFIQARMSSKRLPKKSLMTISGRPMLYWVIYRVRQSLLASDLIVLTSTSRDDDEIEAFCSHEGVQCIRGDLTNVYNRFIKALFETKAQSFIRISGDSPLIDPALIDQAVSLYEKSDVDIVTNTLPRSFPKGQSIEVINSKALLKLGNYRLTSEEKEHVTMGIYNRVMEFKIKNFSNFENYSTVQLSVDSLDDLELIRDIFQKLNTTHLSWKKALEHGYQKLGK